jgi:SlyX protein
MSLETRINELETKVTFQDSVIEDLNQQIINLFQQQQEFLYAFERLNEQCQQISPQRLATESEETLPPHY